MSSMADVNDLVRLIKKAAVDAVKAGKPANVIIGVVTSASPLKVKISEKVEVSGALLICPQHLTNHQITLKDGDDTKTVQFMNALKKNEKVALLSNQGGQQFFILDRIEEA